MPRPSQPAAVADGDGHESGREDRRARRDCAETVNKALEARIKLWDGIVMAIGGSR